MSERVYVFSTGSQYADWGERNCQRCTKYNPERYTGECELDGAMGVAYLTDGRFEPDIAARLGYVEGVAWTNEGFAYTWDCPERVPREEEH